MRLVVLGGDARAAGLLRAAEKAGWACERLDKESDFEEGIAPADVAALPWPVSFREGRLVCGQEKKPEKARVLAALPACKWLLCGRGVSREELPRDARILEPERDEPFLVRNAQLTAEGAVSVAMTRGKRALLGSTCLVTGYGRIGRALVDRLAALGAFVVVCARSEAQMQAAHEAGAHPIPLGEIHSVAGAADVLFNTVPARVFDRDALSAIRRDALLIELASAPYGEDIDEAVKQGISLLLESGLPGRYAPGEAGQALFEMIERATKREE